MVKPRPRVAVVDDEIAVCKALERLLRSAGMDVDVYSRGDEFLEAALGYEPDCLILDLHMLPISGGEVRQALTRRGSRMPVIVITGHDTPESRRQSTGAAAYFAKPVDAEQLLAAISAATAGQE